MEHSQWDAGNVISLCLQGLCSSRSFHIQWIPCWTLHGLSVNSLYGLTRESWLELQAESCPNHGAPHTSTVCGTSVGLGLVAGLKNRVWNVWNGWCSHKSLHLETVDFPRTLQSWGYTFTKDFPLLLPEALGPGRNFGSKSWARQVHVVLGKEVVDSFKTDTWWHSSVAGDLLPCLGTSFHAQDTTRSLAGNGPARATATRC